MNKKEINKLLKDKKFKKLVNKTKKQWENMERIRELLEKYTPEIRNNTKWTPKHQEAYKEVVKKTREEEDNFSAIFLTYCDGYTSDAQSTS